MTPAQDAVRPPSWLDALVAALPGLTTDQVTRFAVPDTPVARRSGVLVLFGEGEHGPDVLLTERASSLRAHAGQPAFPGGRIDPGDDGPVGAALREAHEEVGLNPDTVTVLGTYPPLWVPVSRFEVTPVLAWWHAPHPVGVVDTAEVAAVRRTPLSELVDPARRVTVTHPSGYRGAGFDLDGLLVWGFTAGVLDSMLAVGGWEQPWDRARLRELDVETVRLARRTADPGADSGADPGSWS